MNKLQEAQNHFTVGSIVRISDAAIKEDREVHGLTEADMREYGALDLWEVVEIFGNPDNPDDISAALFRKGADKSLDVKFSDILPVNILTLLIREKQPGEKTKVVLTDVSEMTYEEILDFEECTSEEIQELLKEISKVRSQVTEENLLHLLLRKLDEDLIQFIDDRQFMDYLSFEREQKEKEKENDNNATSV